VWIFVAVGLAVLGFFLHHIAVRERRGEPALLSPSILRNKVSNLGLVTQNMQWLTMQGTFFVVSVFLQQVRGYNAIQTGLILTPATLGILASGALAGRLSRRHPLRRLVYSGFVATSIGTVLLLVLVRATSPLWTFVPGLLLLGLGVGVMLTASVNVVQSAFGEAQQGEISGLSRSISNLGSALGTAIAGSVLVSSLVEGNKHFVLALVTLLGFGLIGLAAALLLPVTGAAGAGGRRRIDGRGEATVTGTSDAARGASNGDSSKSSSPATDPAGRRTTAPWPRVRRQI
jgi:MFS family permease